MPQLTPFEILDNDETSQQLYIMLLQDRVDMPATQDRVMRAVSTMPSPLLRILNPVKRRVGTTAVGVTGQIRAVYPATGRGKYEFRGLCIGYGDQGTQLIGVRNFQGIYKLEKIGDFLVANLRILVIKQEQ